MPSLSGDELHELSERQDPRLLRALDVVAPGGALREGIDNIVHSRTGGLIVVGDLDDISHMLSGGIKLDVDSRPAMLYQGRRWTVRSCSTPRRRRSPGPTCS